MLNNKEILKNKDGCFIERVIDKYTYIKNIRFYFYKPSETNNNFTMYARVHLDLYVVNHFNVFRSFRDVPIKTIISSRNMGFSLLYPCKELEFKKV